MIDLSLQLHLVVFLDVLEDVDAVLFADEICIAAVEVVGLFGVHGPHILPFLLQIEQIFLQHLALIRFEDDGQDTWFDLVLNG